MVRAKRKILTLVKAKAQKAAPIVSKSEPYEKNNAVTPLYMLMAIVPDGQEKYVREVLFKAEVPAALVFGMRASGTASTDVREVLGMENSHKRLITAVVRKDTYLAAAEKLEAKFRTSPYSAGIAVLFALTGLYGLSAYKMLSHFPSAMGTIDRRLEDRYMDSSKEAVIAIVNDGYSDLVMEAARAAGARGGTIVKARGSGSKEAESFYGVVVTPEKEAVIIIVDRAVKDAVLSAVGKECGLQTKGQGICFSVPVSGSVGLGHTAVREDGGEKQPE